jgi:hypothetical protein
MELNNFFVLKWSEDAFIKKKKKNSGAVGLESFFKKINFEKVNYFFHIWYYNKK